MKKILLIASMSFFLTLRSKGGDPRKALETAQKFVSNYVSSTIYATHFKVDYEGSHSIHYNDSQLIDTPLAEVADQNIAFFEIKFNLSDEGGEHFADLMVRTDKDGNIVRPGNIERNLKPYVALFRGRIKISWIALKEILKEQKVVLEMSTVILSQRHFSFEWVIIEKKDQRTSRTLNVNAETGKIRKQRTLFF